MPRLYLFRHGIAADPGDPAYPNDPDRPLTEEGRRKTAAAAEGFAELEPQVSLVLSSPYLRALETAAIVMKALELSRDKLKTTDALIPSAEPQLLFTELSRAGASEVLCAGHAPNLDLVLAYALGVKGRAVTSLKKAGAAALEITSWKNGQGRLLWLLPPKTLRELS